LRLRKTRAPLQNGGHDAKQGGWMATHPLRFDRGICMDGRRTTVFVVAALLLGASMLAGCASPARTTMTDDTATLTALLRAQADAWDKAIVRKDRAAIEANMAEDFRQIDGSGNVETKRSFVDDLVSADLQLDPYTVEEFEVRLLGDVANVALLSGRTRMTGRYQSKPFASHYRYIDIYVRRDGQWKIVSVQISRIPNN
jgi:ketosteroid isomerase-like protein